MKDFLVDEKSWDAWWDGKDEMPVETKRRYIELCYASMLVLMAENSMPLNVFRGGYQTLSKLGVTIETPYLCRIVCGLMGHLNEANLLDVLFGDPKTGVDFQSPEKTH